MSGRSGRVSNFFQHVTPEPGSVIPFDSRRCDPMRRRIDTDVAQCARYAAVDRSSTAAVSRRAIGLHVSVLNRFGVFQWSSLTPFSDLV